MLYRFWEHIIEPIFTIVHPKVIVEIGSKEGFHTRKILEYCRKVGATLHVIDPVPLPDLPALLEEFSHHLVFHEGLSLDVLPTIAGYDAVLIDGDHNWYTVRNELAAIERHVGRGRPFPLIFLHDVDWPYGRRDAYADPERIPEAYRHPHAIGGVVPDQPGVQADRGINPEYCHAASESGARNGVRTAIEDFLREIPISMEFVDVPGFHGLGILTSRERLEKNPDLGKFLVALRPNKPLLGHVESIEGERLREKIAADLECREMQQTISAVARERENMEREQTMERQAFARIASDMVRMCRSRSWRWTAPIRRAEATLRNVFANDLTSFASRRLRYVWTGLRSPIHPLVQRRRYRLRRTPWSPHTTTPQDPAFSQKASVDVSVMIPCHNYGHFLSEAIESVLTQTVRPLEIVVLDDASDDDTCSVTARYHAYGVRYERFEERSLSRTRNRGAMLTTGKFLLFLDADDALPPTYIAECLRVIEDPRIAVAYGDMQHTGDERHRVVMPAFDRDHLERRNYISSHALIRRQAFDLVGGYRELPDHALEDWDFYRRVLRTPWKAAKANTFVRYRVHGRSMLRREPRTYPTDAAVYAQPVTIFTPFAGRSEIFFRYLEGIRGLHADPAHISVHWYDTSNDPVFGALLRKEMGMLPFAVTTYTEAPLPSLWKHTPQSLIRHRVEDKYQAQYYYEMAVVRAYNTMLTTASTEFILVLEDDIVPEPMALRRMLQTMDSDVTAVVAHYPCHLQGYSMVRKHGAGGAVVHFPERRTGIEEVGGSGFGCTLLRMSALRSMPIQTKLLDAPRAWYDHVAFDHLRSQGRVLCNWDIDVEHVKTERFASPSKSGALSRVSAAEIVSV